MVSSKRVFWLPVIGGIVLIIIGLAMRMPGGALTTYEGLNGESTSNYAFDNRYSAIDEYVGGDAYNYIIGAGLVGAKIAGTMAAKAVYIVGGVLCLLWGLTRLLQGDAASAQSGAPKSAAPLPQVVPIETPRAQAEVMPSECPREDAESNG